ncbi:MAG: ferritin family protein [Acidobacteria bacterium]|nr:ferritin family protein [Acidobacteriota bacterium]
MDSASRKNVLEVLKSAIITELRGYEIYKAAAEKATDANCRLMFQKLAEDELAHKVFLEQNFKSILKDGAWSVPATPQNLSPLDHSEIITPDFLKRVKGGAFEMAAVATGCTLERAAIDFYAKAANDCEDEESAKTFRFLATWEMDHMRSLSELEFRMRDEYFAEQGFSRL